jgi:hypothetical protein
VFSLTLSQFVAGRTTDAVSGPRYRDRVMTFVAWIVFVGGTALLVMLAEPPAVVVAIIAVTVAGVLLTSLVPHRINSRARRPVRLARPPVSPPAPDAPPVA